MAARPTDFIKCSRCGETKDANAFPSLGRQCRLCIAALAKQWYLANNDRGKASRRAWNATNKPSIKIYNREYRQKNSESVRAAKQAYYYADIKRDQNRCRAWREKNPEKAKAVSHRKLARIKNAEGKWTAAEWAALKESHGNRCAACGSTNRLEADHIIPLARGGTNWISNIQPLCKSCNCKKRHFYAKDFRTGKVYELMGQKP